MRLILVFFVGIAALAQPDIATIVENDPFDPDRGRKEILEEQVLEEAAPLPTDLPVLDGTMVIGKKKIALFSYMEEGTRKHMTASINETVAGYKVTQIQDREVQLSGEGSPVSLRLFNGEKPNRGGSKKAMKKVTSKKSTSKMNARKANQKKGDSNIISPTAKKDNAKKPKKRFVPRKPMKKTQAQKQTDKKKDRFKDRF